MKRLLLVLILAAAAAWGWHSYNGGWWPGSGESVSATQQGQGRGGRRARFGGEGPIPVIATPARFADVPVTVHGGEKTIQWSACVCAGVGGVKVGHWIG